MASRDRPNSILTVSGTSSACPITIALLIDVGPFHDHCDWSVPKKVKKSNQPVGISPSYRRSAPRDVENPVDNELSLSMYRSIIAPSSFARPFVPVVSYSMKI